MQLPIIPVVKSWSMSGIPKTRKLLVNKNELVAMTFVYIYCMLSIVSGHAHSTLNKIILY